MAAQTIECIDSHTEGEPTRVIVSGGPLLGCGSMAQRLETLRTAHDWLRSASVNEPRGSDALVGALLCAPVNASAAAGVIFFNNVGYLNMCGHGTIGLIATLAYMGRIAPGSHRIETPVGDVVAHLHDDGAVSIDNVPSYRHRTDVEVRVDGLGVIRGDVAWGGNWFFLCESPGIPVAVEHIERLTAAAWEIRRALARAGITGAGNAEIDHIELFGPAARADCNSRNFVLCPGKAYDRSPCGTGTSAKLACLFADGLLAAGEPWGQESVIGSMFNGSVRAQGDQIIPTITGRAHITGRSTLMLDPADPFRYGIKP